MNNVREKDRKKERTGGKKKQMLKYDSKTETEFKDMRKKNRNVQGKLKQRKVINKYQINKKR